MQPLPKSICSGNHTKGDSYNGNNIKISLAEKAAVLCELANGLI